MLRKGVGVKGEGRGGEEGLRGEGDGGEGGVEGRSHSLYVIIKQKMQVN